MATWAQTNLARFQNASDAFNKGAEMKWKGGESMRDTLKHLTDKGVEMLMPNINAQANINQVSGLEAERARRLGFAKGEELPSVPVGETLPNAVKLPEAQMPSIDDLYAEKGASAVGGAMKTGTSDISPDDGVYQVAQKLTGDGNNYKKLMFIDEAGNKINWSQAQTGEKNAYGGMKLKPGLTVDTEDLKAKGLLKPGVATSGVRGTTVAEGAVKPYDEFKAGLGQAPEQPTTPVNLPEQTRMPAQGKPASLQGMLGIKGNSWETGDLPQGWGMQTEEYDLDKKVREAKQTDIYNMRLEQIKSEFPEASVKEQEWMAVRAVHGWPPIDYSKGDTEKEQREKGDLYYWVSGVMGELPNSPAMKDLYTVDPMTGKQTIRPDVTKEQFTERFIDYFLNRSRALGVQRWVQDPKYRQAFGKIDDSSTERLKETSQDARNYLRTILNDTYGDLRKAAEETTVKSGGGSWDQAGDTLGMIFGGPFNALSETASAIQMGGPMPPVSEESFKKKWETSNSFRISLRIAGITTWEQWRDKVLPSAPDWAFKDGKNPYKTSAIPERLKIPK